MATTNHDDDAQWMRQTLQKIDWPQPSPDLSMRILAAAFQPQTPVMPVSRSPLTVYHRGIALMAAILLISFGLGAVAGVSTASPVMSNPNPFYASSGTTMMAQFLKYDGDHHEK